MTIRRIPVASCDGRSCHTRQPLTDAPEAAMESQLASLGWQTVPAYPAPSAHYCPACKR